MNSDTIKIKVEMEGTEEAQEKIEEIQEKVESLADVLNRFSPQVTIRNCKDCSIYVYPSQTIFDHSDDE